MKKKKKIKDEALIYILLIMLIIVFIFTGFGKTMTNSFNVAVENLFMIKDKNIIIDDKYTKNYIESLENNIDELQKIIKLNKEKNYKCINSTVIYRNPTYWYNTLTIDKGTKDGIRKGSMVTNNEGLIGTVTETLKNSSIITLLTNNYKDNKITVGIKYDEKMIYGLIEGYDFIKNEIIVKDITNNLKYIDNMDVVTTNFTNTYANGIPIGVVGDILENKNNLSKIVRVIPIVDFNDIKYVCVLGEK